MRICKNGKYRDLTPEEVAAMKAAQEQAEAEYWQNTPYEDAVDSRVRERYSLSQELAILRQRDIKPKEFEEYFAFCEGCKKTVKEKREKHKKK